MLFSSHIVICSFLMVGLASAATFEQIWLAPANYSNDVVVREPFSAANRGEWFESDVAVGSRSFSAVLMDSKKILWIVGGGFNYNDQGPPNVAFGVWNYNATSDKYRWVWKPANVNSDDNYNPGELGVESDLNSPGDLITVPTTIDYNDNIWVAPIRGELWMFNTSSWMWVRVQGLQNETFVPSFGVNTGQAAADVWPGANKVGNMLADSHNNLWLMCGTSQQTEDTNAVTVNTVWHFNTTSKYWRFVSGDKDYANISPTNATYFGGFAYAGCDIDEDDKVWCYGAYAFESLWTFDTRSETWSNKFRQSVLEGNVANPNDFDPDNAPSVGTSGYFVNRRDGTFMLVTSNGPDAVWLYNVTFNQWKLLYGNISSEYLPGVYVTRREPGSTRPAVFGFAAQSGLNFDGDVYIHGGNIDYRGFPFIKDIWLIPQNQCLTTANKCDTNADCIDQLIGYSCQCRQGYQGDGFACALPQVPVANSPKSATSNVSRLVGSAAWIFVVVMALIS